MSASRDEKTGKRTAQCYYENWKGEKKHKKKCGCATKKEALEWEREFLKSTSANMDMMLDPIQAYLGADVDDAQSQ